MKTISVDDNINTAEQIVKIMTEIDPTGEHVAFSDVENALVDIKDKLPDVAWLDIEMPGISGLELAAKIKNISPKTNIIFVTGHEKFAYQSFKLHASGFILKPFKKEDVIRELDNLRNPIERRKEGGKLRIQCFGNFEVFDIEGNPVVFKRARCKELLAYLVDRRGALCTNNELCAVLFEDRTEDNTSKSMLRTYFSKLKKDLNNVGADDVIVKAWNSYGIDASKIECDYYNYIEGDTYAINSFQAEYMSQYSWAEMTLGELIMKSDND
ncbi:MAG: response regulator [Lachnospiraceae bacterium]|jgi:two-component SAPR family response regulator|nr:response regulator [Lachnospiraceae bacterium]